MITTENLWYTFADGSIGLSDISIELPTHSRTLLVGSNGAGKSTLLRVLAGKTLARSGSVSVDGRDPFRDTMAETTYLGTEWAASTTVRRDIAVTLLIASVGGDTWPDRRDELVDILDIDLRWHMHQVSDGERRRVQLCMGLLRPWTTLLLDEVTVDLDVVVRARLLDFLRRETDTRSCQVVYATHIFDGLTGWPTNIVHMHWSTVKEVGPTEEILRGHNTSPGSSLNASGSPLLSLALDWLTSDLKDRGSRENSRKRVWSEVAGELGLEHQDRFDSYFKLTRGRA